MLRAAYDGTDGSDGRVSIEVDPRLAHDTDSDHRRGEARCGGWSTGRTCSSRSRPPQEGLPAITAATGRGHQRQRHADLLPGPLPRGHGRLPDRAGAGARPTASTCRRSARWRRSSSAGSTPRSTSGWTRSARDEAQGPAQQGRDRQRPAGLRAYEEVFASDRWKALEAAGAQQQRPLWASTGVKDPDFPDTMYVDELVAPGTVNTMPEATIDALADHGEITGDTVTDDYDDAQQVIDRPGEARHRLRRRRPGARGRGRGEVRGVLAGAARHRQRGAARRPQQVRPPLAVTHARRRTTTLRRHAGRRPGRQPARRQGPHALGPGRRGRGVDPARLGRPARDVAAAARRDRRAAGRAVAEGLDHVVLSGMGGSSLAPEVITAHATRAADDPRHHRPERIRRALGGDRLDARSSSCPASPAARSRPTATGGHFVKAFDGRGHRRRRPDRRRHRPGLAAGEAGRPTRATARSSSPTRTSAAATAR